MGQFERLSSRIFATPLIMIPMMIPMMAITSERLFFIQVRSRRIVVCLLVISPS